VKPFLEIPHPAPPPRRKAGILMRRTILVVATMALTLMVASGVALAVTKIGTDGHDNLKGTKGQIRSPEEEAATGSMAEPVMT
jgi:hypothetical protein